MYCDGYHDNYDDNTMRIIYIKYISIRFLFILYVFSLFADYKYSNIFYVTVKAGRKLTSTCCLLVFVVVIKM